MEMEPLLALGSIFKGLIIGIVASAPMGPVGVLIIQRTLNKGRWYGFVTGVGAALSDMLYALITAFGMSFVSFIVDAPNPWTRIMLQLVGSVLLFAFGLYTYKTKPQTNLPHRPGASKGSLMQNGLTGFFITLSNPLMVFMFIALFAQFSFIIPVEKDGASHPLEQMLGFLSIIVGALVWWFGVSYTINNLRTKFDDKRIFMLNHIIGIIVMVISFVGFVFTISGGSLYN